MHIRDANGHDAPVIVELVRELAAGEGETTPLTPEFVQSYLDSQFGKVLLAEERGMVVGLLSYSARPDLYHAGNSGLIEILVVRADARCQGIGTALLQAVIVHAQKEHWAEIGVSTTAHNTRAINLYRALGFTDESLLLEQHLP